MTTPTRLLSCALVCVLVLGGMQSAPPVQEPFGFAPIGTIVAWWGLEANVPEGWEVCDGRNPSTPGAVLRDPKPDLRDRFLKGAQVTRAFNPRAYEGGGSNTLSLSILPTTLTVAQLPAHDHGIGPHTHPIPDHAHAMPHNHGVPDHDHGVLTHQHPMDHTHNLGSHSHALGTFASVATGGTTPVMLLREAPPGAALTTSTSLATTPDPTLTTAGATAATDMETNVVTLGPSMANTSSATGLATLSSTATTAMAGMGQAHTHQLSQGQLDNRPLHLDVLFLIRVK